MTEKKHYYIQLNCTEAQKNHMLAHAKMIRIEATDMDILFQPDDYIDGDIRSGRLSKSGWDKLFSKK